MTTFLLIAGLTVPWGLALWGWIKVGILALEARGLRFEHAAERAARVELQKAQETWKKATGAEVQVLVDAINKQQKLLEENDSPEMLQKRLNALRGPSS